MRRFLLACTALLALTGAASAANITVTNVTGTWVDIDPNFVAGSTGLGTNEIRWGVPAGNPFGQSGYRFDGVAPPSQTFAVGSNFGLGTFTHYNFPINSGTSITGATMNVSITFTSDLFLGTKTLNSQFIFAHNETPNTGPAGCCDDIVTAILNPAKTDLFSFGGIDYAFGVTGFQVGGIPFAQFSSPEGGMNTALLRGSFADVTTFAVPGPLVGAGMPGLVAAFGGLIALSRHRRRKAA